MVVTLAPLGENTKDDVPFGEACRRLELAGAVVVGINCYRGPITFMPLLKEIREACKVMSISCQDKPLFFDGG